MEDESFDYILNAESMENHQKNTRDENYDYVFRLAETWDIDPSQMAIWRSYSAVPMHGRNGCIMGFYFGKYAFTAEKKYLVLSLLIPCE